MADTVLVYITKEQAERIAALAHTAEVGVQLETDDSDNTPVNVVFRPCADLTKLSLYVIEPDGKARPN